MIDASWIQKPKHQQMWRMRAGNGFLVVQKGYYNGEWTFVGETAQQLGLVAIGEFRHAGFRNDTRPWRR